MSTSPIKRTPSVYDYPLLIKHLLHTPLAIAPEQEIVYQDITRFPYWRLRQRIGQLASGLAALGVRPGDTVAVMDWDSHRYLECFFAVPMMGAMGSLQEQKYQIFCIVSLFCYPVCTVHLYTNK